MTPPVDGADFLAALVASCFLGAFPPVDFLAVCFVRAMTGGVDVLRCRTKLAGSVCAPCVDNVALSRGPGDDTLLALSRLLALTPASGDH